MENILTESYVKQRFWQTPDNNLLSVQQALLGADALDHVSVEALADANKVIIDVPQGCVAIELRFYAVGTADLDDIVQLYAAASTDSMPDHYRHFSQLTMTLGTQIYTATQEFHDTIVPANEAWITTPAEVSPGNNTFASYSLNTHGNNKILIIASDLDNTSIGVQWRQF